MQPWYKKSFGEDYMLAYQHRTSQDAKKEVEQLMKWLHLTINDHILDLCCGSGRHSIALAEKNLHVLGFDLSTSLLKEAVKLAKNVPVSFIHGDMRELPFVEQSFDVVLNLFTSFGYFERDGNNMAVLSEMKRVLKPRGRYCIDFLNPDYVRKYFVPHSERWVGESFIKEEREIKGNLVVKTMTVQDQNGERRYFERVKMYTKEEMSLMLKQTGLPVEQVFGNFLGETFSEESERMILLGRVD